MTKVMHDSETKAEGQQVVVACAFIHHNFDGIEKIFLAKRADTKKFMPSVYELPGGHVDFGEDPADAVVREVQEEFHKTIAVGDPCGVFSYMNEVKGAHATEIVYFAHFTDGNDGIQINPEDHADYQWFSEATIDEMLGNGKGADDDEYLLIRRAFRILAGGPIKL